jgi:hypothetical protein
MAETRLATAEHEIAQLRAAANRTPYPGGTT